MASTEQAPDERPALFGALWGIATLFHLAAPDKRWIDHWSDYPTTAAACFLLMRPSSPGRLVLLAACQVLDVFVEAPMKSNHWTFTGVTALLILLAAGRLALKERRLNLEGRALLETFSVPVRLNIYVLYFYVVFHKLNDHFLDPAVSCGHTLWVRMVEVWPFLPQSTAIDITIIGATLIIESAIPILLALRRTRSIGMVVAVGFHASLAANPFYVNFSAMLIALMVVFMDPSVPGRLRRHLADSPLGTGWQKLGGARPRVLAGLLVIAVAAGLYVDTRHGAALDAVARWGFLVYAAVALLAYVTAIRSGGLGARRARSWPCPPEALAIVVLYALNGAAPYLGLKTESSLAMYSNLRTEGELPSNHLIIRRPLDLFGWQRELVEVVDSSDRSLRRLRRRGQLVTYFEFRAYLSRHPEVSVRYRHRGREWLVPRVGDDPHLSRRVPWPLRKLVIFRTVDGGDKTRCTH